MVELNHVGCRWPLEDSGYYCYFTMWYGHVVRASRGQQSHQLRGSWQVCFGPGPWMDQMYSFLTFAAPSWIKRIEQQGLQASKGQARKTQKF